MRRWLLPVILVSMVWGCRGTRPEAGLPPSAFDGPMPRVVANDRGFWFLVSSGPAEAPFVALGEGDGEELFVVRDAGSRTMRLFPATPFAYSLLDASRDGTVQPRWIESVPAAAVPDRIGYSTDGLDVEWAGGAPAEGARLVLLQIPPSEDASLSTFLAGAATFSNGRVSQLDQRGTATGPFLVVAEPPRSPESFVVATLGDVAAPDGNYTVRKANAELPPSEPNRFLLRPVALEAGADVLLSRGGEVDHVALTSATSTVVRGLPLGITDDTFEVHVSQSNRALAALAAVRDGAFLTAAYHLSVAEPTSGGRTFPARLRIGELLGAAGYVDYVRQFSLAEAPGLDADVALWLGRAHMAGGDLSRGIDFVDRAIDRFGYWFAPGSYLGRGTARVVRARLAVESEEDFATAIEQLLLASADFTEADDAMRAAEAELLAAQYALAGRADDRAVKAGLLARSRYYHGHSAYWSGFAEITLADIYARAGETGEAQKMARFALLRFDELGNEVAKNRARMAEARSLAATSPMQAIRELQVALEKASTLGDDSGAMDATASLVMLGHADQTNMSSYGLRLVRGAGRVEGPLARGRLFEAISTLCERGLVETVSSAEGATSGDVTRAAALCGTAAARTPVTQSASLGGVLQRGWEAMLAGDLVTARRVADEALSQVTDEVGARSPEQAAAAYLLDAAVLRAEGNDPSTRIELARRVLRDRVDPTRLASTLAAMARESVTRSQMWLAADLLAAAVAVAGEQNQNELRRELALEHLAILHADGRWQDLRETTGATESIFEGAGPSSAPSLARLFWYQADALERLGKLPDANIAAGKAEKLLADTGGVDRAELLLFAARLALDRGDARDARAHLELASAAEAEETGLAGLDERVAAIRADVALLRAELAAQDGDFASMRSHYRRAAEVLAAAAPGEAVLSRRIVALRGAADAAAAEDEVVEAIAGLEEVRAMAKKSYPQLIPPATEALATIEISAGRPGRAAEVVEQASALGASSGTTAVAAVCVEGRARALSGEPASALDACARMANGSQRFDAALLRALLTPSESPEKVRAARELLAELDASLTPRDRERAKLISELGVGATRYDSARHGRLQSNLEAAMGKADSGRKAKAVSELADYLVATGRAGEAVEVLDAHSATFYDLGAQGPGRLVRLRAEALVATLRPLDAFNYTARAITETPDMADEDEAIVLREAARNALILGMWQHARALLSDARLRAVDGKNRRLARDLEKLAGRFQLQLTE